MFFGRLSVLRRNGTKGKRATWLCQCQCGKEISVVGAYLRNGDTKSCGCLNIDAIIARNTTHGKSGTSLYGVWIKIVARCCDENDKYYHRYGGRGIKVCERWRKSFEDFLADVGERTEEKPTLDRIDNDGNYEPENVEWASYKRQARHTRRSVNLTHDGVTRCAAEWAEVTGIHYWTIHYRIKAGWPSSKVLGYE